VRPAWPPLRRPRRFSACPPPSRRIGTSRTSTRVMQRTPPPRPRIGTRRPENSASSPSPRPRSAVTTRQTGRWRSCSRATSRTWRTSSPGSGRSTSRTPRRRGHWGVSTPRAPRRASSWTGTSSGSPTVPGGSWPSTFRAPPPPRSSGVPPSPAEPSASRSRGTWRTWRAQTPVSWWSTSRFRRRRPSWADPSIRRVRPARWSQPETPCGLRTGRAGSSPSTFPVRPRPNSWAHWTPRGKLAASRSRGAWPSWRTGMRASP
jgi:hypothetical protein